jgi:hypothetical protein
MRLILKSSLVKLAAVAIAWIVLAGSNRLLAQQAAAPPNISGEWIVYLATPNAAPWRGALEQQGGKIVGYMGNETAEYPVTGTIEGTEVKFGWSLYEAGEKVDIRITGKYERESISGTAKIGAIEEVQVTAQRTGQQ